MEIFLKKYSDVPNGFIEDFFDIVNESYNDNDLSIDFDKIVAWLDVIKANLKRLLVANFREKYDYILEKNIVKNSIGNRYHTVEKIYVTPDCFKELCMLSQTAKAKEVRQYYLSIEKLIRKYHQYIQEKLYQKINLLETNQKPKINILSGIIYFFAALNNVKINELDDDLLKIGKTVNKNNRFNTYSGNANDIEPLFILEVDDIDAVENCIKNLLKEYQYRKNKEIYQISIDALKFVFVNCDKLVSSFKKYMDNNPSRITKPKFKKMRRADKIFLSFKKFS